MKILLNKCFGGFTISSDAYSLYCEKKNIECHFYKENSWNILQKCTFEQVQKDPYCYCVSKDLGNRADYNTLSKYIIKDPRDYDLRTDKTWIEVVEELGEKVDTWASNICVIEIPDGIEYEIHDYDGFETVYEKGRCW